MKKPYFLISILAVLLAACGGAPQTIETSLAPGFNLPNSLGGNVSLKDYEGKNVLLFFHMAVG